MPRFSDLGSKPDGQVSLKFYNENNAIINVEETSVIFDDLNPVWNESFQFKFDWNENLENLNEIVKEYNLDLNELNINLDNVGKFKV